MRRRLWIGFAAALLVCAELVAAGWYGSRANIYKFDVVRQGVLWRSGQPRGDNWRTLRQVYGIKTVINLRTREEDPAAWDQEQQICRDMNIRHESIPMQGKAAPSPQQLGKFMDVMRDPSNWPVLVHCEYGTVRTSAMVGAFRLLDEPGTWKSGDVLKEAQKFDFSPEKHPEYVDFWNALAKSGQTSKPSSQPSSWPAQSAPK